MSYFKGDIIVKKIGDRIWEIVVPFSYYVGKEPNIDIITVPKGALTDFASIPRLFWSILPPNGRYTPAAIIHDRLYFTQEMSRKESDKIFYQAMKTLKVSKWKRIIMFRAVRMFGRSAWKNKSKNNKK